MKAQDTYPHVDAYLFVDKHPWAPFAVGWLWRVPKCPFCGKKHVHGGGNVLEAPAPWHLGLRVPHCLKSAPTDYYLVDADQAASIQIKRQARAKLAAAIRAGNRTARRIVERARMELAARRAARKRYAAPAPL